MDLLEQEKVSGSGIS